MSNVSLDRLASTISESLNLYSKRILDGVRDAAEVTVNEMVQTTKQRKPRGRSSGKYVRCISSRVGDNSLTSQSRIWYVKAPRYSLAHLLNNGHRSRSGGHVSGDDHITRAEETAVQRFEERVRSVISRESD